MSLLAFLAAALYWPTVTAAATTPKWAMLSIAVPLLFLLKEPKIRGELLPLGLFLLWSAVTLTWGPLYDGVAQWWQFAVVAGLVALEADYRKVVFWFGVGVSISGVLAIPQYFGWNFIEQAIPPAGLFMNKNFLAEAGLMALVGAVAFRHWLLIPPLICAVILPASLGAFVTAAILALCWVWRKSKRLAIAGVFAGVLLGAIVYPHLDKTAFDARAALYLNTIGMIADKPFGHGIGSYWAAYPFYHDALTETPEVIYRAYVRPEKAHNDFLTVFAETGIPGVFLLGWFLLNVFKRAEKSGWVLLAFLGLGLFNFPLFNPATAFLAAVTCGHILNSRNHLRA